MKNKAHDENTQDAQPKKKKRGCFFNGCLILCLINFALTCVLVCVGWIAGDQFARQRLGMSLTETFGVARGISRSNGKFLNNKYTAADETAFYDSLGDALMLNDGTVDGEELKSTVIDSYNNGNDMAIALGNYAAEILRADNLNHAKIDEIGSVYDEKYNLDITDREIAAFLNGIVSDVVGTVLGDSLKESELVEYGVDPEKLSLNKYLTVEQIKIYEDNGVDMMSGTVSLNFGLLLKEARSAIDVNALVAKAMPQAGGSAGLVKMGVGAAISILKSVLPSKLYATIDMGLSESVTPTIRINNMSNAQMNRLYTLLDKVNVDITTGSNKTFKEQLDDVFIGKDSSVKKTLDDLQLGKILVEGGINCNIYQFIIDAAKLNYVRSDDGSEQLKDPSEQIEAIDILQTFKLILSDQNETYLKSLESNEHAYKNVKFRRNPDGSLDLSSGGPVIEDKGPQYYVAEVSPELLDAYEKYILNRFSHEYGLKDEYTVDEIIDNFSDSFDKDEAVEMFDKQKIKDILGRDAIGVSFDDKMLAALLMKITDGEEFRNNIDVEYVYIEDAKYKGKDHEIIHVALDIDVPGLVSGLTSDKTVQKIVRNLLPKRFVAEAAFDITLRVDDEGYKPTEFLLDGNDIGVINKLLIAFGAFKDDEGNNITLSEYIDGNLVTIRDVINNLSKVLPGLEISSSGLMLPNVYAALSKVINGDKTESDRGYIDPDKIERSLKLITDGKIFDEGKYKFFSEADAVARYNAACEQALLDEIENKYALSSSSDGGSYTLEEILHVLKIVELDDPGKVDGLNVYDLVDPVKLESYASADDGWQDTLKVNIANKTKVDHPDVEAGDMLTAFIKQMIELSGDIDYGPLGDFDIDDLLFVELARENGAQFLKINVRATIKDLLPHDKDSIGEFVEDILPDKPSLITLKIDITSKDSEDCTIIINDNETVSNEIFDLLKALDMDIDLTVVGGTIRDEFFKIEDRNISFAYGDDGLILPNIFEIIDSIVLEGGYGDGGASVKAAFEGVFRTSNNNADEFIENSVLNPVDENPMDLSEIQSKIFASGISDSEFGAFIKDSLKDKVGEVLELNIITANSRSQKQLGDRQKFEALGYGLDEDKTYMTLTASVKFDKFDSADGTETLPENIKEMMPEQMLVTFVLRFNESSGKFEYTYFIINGMDKKARQTLIDIIGLDSAVENLEAVADQCLEPINQLLETLSSVGIVEVRHVFTEDMSTSTSRGIYRCEIVR